MTKFSEESTLGVWSNENWNDKDEYQRQLKDLISQFQENFKKYNVMPEIISAGPGFDG